MKKVIVVLVGALCVSQSVSAILAPIHQSVKELNAIINNPKIIELGHGNAIIDVRKSDKGYVVVTAETEMAVDVVYKPVKRPGPVKFDLVFHDVAHIAD